MLLVDARPASRVLATQLLVISVGLLIFMHVFQPLAPGLWTQTLFNSLHVPVFGFIALSLYVATAAWANWNFLQRAVIVSFSILVTSVLSEAAQIPGPRDASLSDLVSDWLGAAAMLLFTRAYSADDARRRKTRLLSALTGAAVLIVALSSLILVSVAYLERAYLQPVLFSFDANLGHYFRRMQYATLTIISDANGTARIGQITLDQGPWPGIIFENVWRDWRGYSTLVVDIGLVDNEPLDINIRIHDHLHSLGDQPYNDRNGIVL